MNIMQYSVEIKDFDQLSNLELYTILQLRSEVFVVEQNCPYQDLDGKDYESQHLLCRNEQGELVAYLRILDKGISYKNYVSIGRVVNKSTVRNKGLGKLIMKSALEYCDKNYNSGIKISAQYHLSKFYQSFGFMEIGEVYLEDDIPHIAMILD